jgi:hypothetical protein
LVAKLELEGDPGAIGSALEGLGGGAGLLYSPVGCEPNGLAPFSAPFNALFIGVVTNKLLQKIQTYSNLNILKFQQNWMIVSPQIFNFF